MPLGSEFVESIITELGGVSRKIFIDSTNFGKGADGEDGTDGTNGTNGTDGADGTDITDAEVKTKYENNADTNEFSDAEQTKLAGIETAATADQTGAEIKTAYEGEADTNAFTDAEQTKLAGIEALAEVNDVDSVNSQTGTVVLDADDISDAATTNKFTTAAEISKLTGIEASATADQSNAEIKTAYEANANTNEYDDAEQTKLAGIASGAQVNTVDSVNTQTGAVVLDADDISDAATTNKFTTAAEITKLSGIETSATADQTAGEIKTAYESNADTNEFSDAEQTKLAGIETAATADQSNAEIKTAYEANANTNEFSDAEQTKLAGIETSATADQTGAEIKTAYEGESNTNAFTDALLTKLNGIETSATADQTDAEIETAYNNQVAIVSQGDAEAGTSTTPERWTPQRVKQAIDALGGSGIANVVEDTTPQLGGDLDVNGKKIVAVSGSVFVKLSDTGGVSKVVIQDSANVTQITMDSDGNITLNGVIDGRNVASDGTKLDGIESNSTADQSNAEIKTAYEANANTNEFSDAEQTKLAGIEALAEVNDVDSVNSQTGAVVLDADDISDTSTTNKFTTAAEISKLSGIETSATADQTDAEIKTAYEANADTNEFSDAEQTKLAGIEASATADQSNVEIKTAYEANADTNEFSDAEQTKLAGIETAATTDQTDAEIKTSYENNADTNEFSDAEQTKLAGMPITAGFASSGQTITSAALLTLAHSLGAEPKIAQLIIQCTTAEHNYSIGDRVLISYNNSDAGTSRVTQVYWDSTNVFVRYSNDTFPIIIGNKTTGAKIVITKSRWQLYVRAFA